MELAAFQILISIFVLLVLVVIYISYKYWRRNKNEEFAQFLGMKLVSGPFQKPEFIGIRDNKEFTFRALCGSKPVKTRLSINANIPGISLRIEPEFGVSATSHKAISGLINQARNIVKKATNSSDITIGNKNFDDIFSIKGKPEEAIKKILTLQICNQILWLKNPGQTAIGMKRDANCFRIYLEHGYLVIEKGDIFLDKKYYKKMFDLAFDLIKSIEHEVSANAV